MLVQHLPLLPIAAPLVAGAALLFAGRVTPAVQRAVSGATVLVLLVAAATLVVRSDAAGPDAYLLGNWPPQYGIALVADRLASVMLALVAVLGAASLWLARGGADTATPHFHALFQFQLMGLNGAFLTADLFNLFVFFEVLLIASYALLVQGGGGVRLRNAMRYAVFNLMGSALFLLGVSLLYAVAGTLDLAALARRVPQLSGTEATLAHAAGSLLLVVFGVKAALFPLCFWLPRTYSAALVPVTVLFAVMTKVGVYALLRVHGQLFATPAGGAGADVLVLLGLAGLAFGALGTFTTREPAPLAGYVVVGSAGLLLAAVGMGGVEATALYYLLQGTLVAAALFVVTAALAPAEARGGEPMVGGLFVLAAAAAAGFPPSPGFIAKFELLHALPATSGDRVLFWCVVLASSLLTLLGLARVGADLCWRAGDAVRVGGQRTRLAPAVALLGLVSLLVVFAAPVQTYLRAAAASLAAPGGPTPGVPGGPTPGVPGGPTPGALTQLPAVPPP
jgi:multicomponent K+:H+ antiporter subunit D